VEVEENDGCRGGREENYGGWASIKEDQKLPNCARFVPKLPPHFGMRTPPVYPHPQHELELDQELCL
jgi:hypothetical protein